MIVDVTELDNRVPESLTDPDSLIRAQSVIEDAEALVLDEGDPEWDSDTIPARARQIIIAVAMRAWRNPDGLTQSSVGDVSVSYSRTGVEGAVYLTKAEQRSVRKLAQRSFVPATYEDPYPPRLAYWFVGQE